MEDGLVQIMIELAQPIGALLAGGMILMAKVILSRVREISTVVQEVKGQLSGMRAQIVEIEKRFTQIDRKIEDMRNEFRADIHECIRREVCASHRENLSRRIDMLCMHQHTDRHEG